jgi:hypothetical protein
MIKCNSSKFYKKLNSFYNYIQSYNKDMIYDYNFLYQKEKKEKSFNIAIFIRKSGTFLFDFETEKITTFQTYYKNSDKIMLVQKVVTKLDDVYYITTKNIKK